jgi:hypothetical protein
LSNVLIEHEALRASHNLYPILPVAVANVAATIPDVVAKAERDGDVIVEDTTGRLIAAALRSTPADIGRNPPELPESGEATADKLRTLQSLRLARLIRDHDAVGIRRRAQAHGQRKQ